MRVLTFKGFLKTYTHALSLRGAYGVSVLAKEADADNFRLRAPLFFFATITEQTEALLANTTGALHEEYETLLGKCETVNIEHFMEKEYSSFPEEYQKVWKAYLVRKNQHITDDRMKENARQRIRKMCAQKNVSVYRICKDLQLNVGNVNAWLLHGEERKISYSNATRVMKYLMQATAAAQLSDRA